VDLSLRVDESRQLRRPPSRGLRLDVGGTATACRVEFQAAYVPRDGDPDLTRLPQAGGMASSDYMVTHCNYFLCDL